MDYITILDKGKCISETASRWGISYSCIYKYKGIKYYLHFLKGRLLSLDII